MDLVSIVTLPNTGCVAALALAVTNFIMSVTVTSRPSVCTILSTVSCHFTLGVREPVYDFLKVVMAVQLAYVANFFQRVDAAG